MSKKIKTLIGSYLEMISKTECFIQNNDSIKIQNCNLNFEFDFVKLCLTISKKMAINIGDYSESTIQNVEQIYNISCNICFENVHFRKGVNFKGVRFLRRFEFLNIVSEEIIEFNVCDFDSQYFELYGENMSDVIIENIYNTPSLIFIHCCFNSTTTIMNVKLSSGFVMNKSKINKLVEIYQFGVIYDDTIQLLKDVKAQVDLITFDDIVINKELRISLMYNFCNSSFCRLTVSKNATLAIKEYNNKTFNIYGINIGDIKIHKSYIDGILSLSDCCFRKIRFDEVSVNGNIIENNVSYATLDNIETATILKNQALKQSNIKQYNHYRAEEQERLFRNSISDPLNKLANKIRGVKTKKTIRTKVNQCLDGILVFFYSMIIAPFSKEGIVLWFNKYSNNFGLSWWRGMLFTISVAFIFYTLFFITINSVIWFDNPLNWLIFQPNYWKYVFEYLWLPDGIKELKEAPYSSLWSYIWFIFGKIVIAYGIYQTISAFRKYSK